MERKILIWIWIVALTTMATLIMTVSTNFLEGAAGLMTGFGLVAILSVAWARKCLQRVGVVKEPAQAVMARWGSKAVRAVGPGLCFILWPIEELRLFPTRQYQLNFRESDVHSKKEGEYGTALMTIDISIYFMWPKVGKEYGEKEKKDGGEILMEKTFYHLPADPNDAEELKDFFEPGILDGVRRIMVKKTHLQCRGQKDEIEEEIKKYLLEEQGNPFKECGIQSEDLDVAITSIKFTKEMEEAFSAPEIAERKKEATEKMLKAFTNAGVDPIVAGMLVKPIEGKGMTFEQLRDLAIVRLLHSPIEGKIIEKAIKEAKEL